MVSQHATKHLYYDSYIQNKKGVEGSCIVGKMSLNCQAHKSDSVKI